MAYNTFHPMVRRAIAICNRWGFEVVHIKPGAGRLDPGKKSGPRQASLVWPNGPVIMDCYNPNIYHAETAVDIIHELGHLLVGGESIMDHDEVSGPGLALDRAHCQMARLPWLALMGEFEVEIETPGVNQRPWPELSPNRRHTLLTDSRQVAIKAGLLTADGRPSFVRPNTSAMSMKET